ncbi:carbohydrate ABC transporter substrate-binding protein [Romboutsia weinsteinii]|uniref:Carbohydrate ABC transporter substrate-binding protein n=1 Tax=Romboutsia weinsteinii TaxID=2020949 RepID=A0A371J8Q7_9FIRM|nr:ABC transporter substrate-binding protein [Romboutsia weinsteinii]RDY29139.1 carbohydrate ABC transporter substrate-binding protein [Romboutsia weinsteinii]
MNKLLRRSIALLTTGLVSISMVACSSTNEKDGESSNTSDGKTITIGMKATQLEVTNMNYHKEQWEAKTGNKLDIQAVDDNQFEQLMLTKMTSGGMWDMFIGDTGTQSTKYNHEKNLEDLSSEAWVSNLSDIGKDFVTHTDGKVYCMPLGGVNSFGIVYNKEVFEKNNIEIPKTYEEFEKACAKLKAEGITPMYVSMGDAWTVNQIINGEWPNILAKNPGLLEKLNNNEIRWDEVPEFVNLFERIKGWVDKGYINSDLSTASYEMAQKAIGSGQAAMMYMGDWADPEYVKTEPSAEGKIGMFAAPSEDGKSYLAAAGPGGLYVSNESKNLDEVKDFLNYMSSEDTIKYDIDKRACTSVWNGITNENISTTLKDSQVYFDEGMSQKHYNQTYVIIPPAESESALLSVLLGQKTPKEAAKIWSDEIIKNGKQLGLDGFTK